MPAWWGWALAATQAPVFVKKQKPSSQLWRPNLALTVQALTAQAWPGGTLGSANLLPPVCSHLENQDMECSEWAGAQGGKGKCASQGEPRWT